MSSSARNASQFSLPGVIQCDILRAEDNAILIGAEPQGKATFVGVMRADVARTEAVDARDPDRDRSRIHVGSTRAEVERALGSRLDDPDRAQDPRIMIPTGLRNTRILLEDDHAVAFVVATEPERAKEAVNENACARPAGNREQHTFGVCLSQSGELARYNGDELSLIHREGERPFSTTRIPGLVYATFAKTSLEPGRVAPSCTL